MKTTIFLNEWTEIEIKESMQELERIIKEHWKDIKNWFKTHNFINVTMTNSLIIESTETTKIKARINEKRILFFYES